MVLPTRDRPEQLARAVASVQAALRPGDELIVVGSASSRPVSAPGARVIEVPTPGASRARNVGWRAAGNDLVAFVDDDVWVDPSWAASVAAAFDDPGVAFVTGRVEMPPGVEHVRPVALLQKTEPYPLDRSTFTGDLGHSANLAVRRRVLEQVGGFDELLGAGGRFRAAEDLDLMDRILALGAVGRYEPAALAWHEQWRSKPELVRLDWAYGTGMGVRITKLARTDRRRARRELLDAMWSFGLRTVPHDAIRLYRFLTLTALSRVAGTVVGMARGLTVPVVDGHLAPRSARRRR